MRSPGIFPAGILLAALAASCGGGGGSDRSDPLHAPVAMDDAAATVEGRAVSIAVLANDTDPDGDPLSIAGASTPGHGTAAVGGGTVLYTPASGFQGTDTFTYTARDPGGDTGTAEVTITVAAGPPPTVILPKSCISADELGVIVNDADAQSVEVAAYYVAARSIPEENVVHVSFPAGGATITRAQFATAKAAVDAALPATVQALVLTWTLPYRVDCMSVTSAFALGFDTKYCSAALCDPTAFVEYYASDSVRPYTDHGIRPAMALAGTSAANVKALIDRGVAADDTFPSGTGWFVRTTDSLRSVRWFDFQMTAAAWDHEGGLDINYVDNSAGDGSNTIQGQTDVLFYLTGLTSVAGIETNTYRPGAVADHVTSYGGVLTDGGQMSCRKWLEAGATASYGTVVEPCNYTAKFPAASELVRFYFRGATVLEAYWKSVAWPGEGIFIGEPLARPWGSAETTYVDHTLTIRLTWLDPAKTYELRAADSEAGPFAAVLTGISIPHHQMATIMLAGATRAVYKLAETGTP